MRVHGYVYETINLANGKRYIGKRSSQKLIRNYLGSGKLILKAIKKYGVQSFSVKQIGIASDRKSLNDLEIYFIGEYIRKYGQQMMYNLSPGGEGGYKGSLTEIGREKKQSAMLGNKHALGSIVSKERREELRKQMIGNSFRRGIATTPESKLKISQALKGRVFSDEHRRKISHGLMGHVVTLESRRKMHLSKAGKPMHPHSRVAAIRFHTGRKHTEETKQRMRTAQKLRRAEEKDNHFE